MRDHSFAPGTESRDEPTITILCGGIGVSEDVGITIFEVGDPPTVHMVRREPAVARKLPHRVCDGCGVGTRYREHLTHQPTSMTLSFPIDEERLTYAASKGMLWTIAWSFFMVSM
jgi:hypothetical protein